MIDVSYIAKTLVSPDNQELALEFNLHDNNFRTEKGHVYPIINNVAILLPQAPVKNIQSKLHEEFGGEFLYSEHYQIDAQEFDYFIEPIGEEAHEIKRLRQRISSWVPANTLSLLDVGCGNGWVSGTFLPKNMFVISMDIASKNARKVFEKYPWPKHLAITADVYHLPIAHGALDCIIASEIMEHLPDPLLFIEKLYNALKTGGRLIITTPYNEKIVYHLCIHCNKTTPANAHIHSFNKKVILEFLSKLGIVSFKIDIFSSKILSKLRSFSILRYMPLMIWKIFDSLFCFLFGKQQRMIIIIEKK